MAYIDLLICAVVPLDPHLAVGASVLVSADPLLFDYSYDCVAPLSSTLELSRRLTPKPLRGADYALRCVYSG